MHEGLRRIGRRRQQAKPQPAYGSAIAVIPAFEKEDEIAETIKSLLTQRRALEKIVIVINGPGKVDTAYQDALPFALEFPGLVIVERPDSINGVDFVHATEFDTDEFDDEISHSAKRITRGGKVKALNWAFRKYGASGKYTYWLGVDADVVADPNMVMHLEKELVNNTLNTLGVMARYGFLYPDDMKKKSRILLMGQRHEFAMTNIRHILRGYNTDILGGQATLFSVHALRKIAYKSEGSVPWSVKSKVEDAELTRAGQALSLATRVSVSARAWTGAMYNGHSFHNQRRKWQDGHLEDMLRDFRPWKDRRRWFDQAVIGWNLAIRLMFVTLVTSSLYFNQLVMDPIWLIPIGLAILQSTLVAIKIPQRRLGEVIQAMLFFPGEIYYWRTLSVWLESIVLAFFSVSRDGWGNQDKAESSKKKRNISGWLTISATAIGLFLLSTTVGTKVTELTGSPELVSRALEYSWYALMAMTLVSVTGMIILCFRIITNYRVLKP